VTGVDDPAVADEALALGAYGYLIKPFLPNEVIINVASALRRRDLERDRRAQNHELEAKLLSRTTALRNAISRLERASSGAKLAERETVERLVTALTLRSEETGEHIERMSRYAATLAIKRGMDATLSEDFRIGAMLHDVGKIGIPDAILLKPGALNQEELMAIRRHPELGASLLGDSRSRVLQLGARIALSHHEHWDGGGYPSGLAGEDIPLEGRVAGIADVFDALTSHRVYRPAMDVEAARGVMWAERGRHFDPELLELFFLSIDDMLAIRANYADPVPQSDVRVVVADSRRLFADALARALAAAGAITVVGVTSSATEAAAMVDDRDVDVLAIDADLGEGGVVTLARHFQRHKPGLSLIVLADRDDDALVLEALEAGCAGVIVRDHAFEELDAAVLAAHRGEPAIAPGRLVALLQRRTAVSNARLTRREHDVLALMAEGLSNEAIAARLIVSLNTVRNHVQRILTKLSSHSKLEAVAEAGRRGLL
jgi:putative two-component system response regulator